MAHGSEKFMAGNSPYAKRRRNALSMIPASGGHSATADQQTSAIGLFSATGCPNMLADYMRMKDMLNTSPKGALRTTTLVGVEKHRPWQSPWGTDIKVRILADDEMLPTRPPPEASMIGRACSRGGMWPSANPFTLPEQGPPKVVKAAVAFHPLGMSTDLKFDTKGTKTLYLTPGLNKKAQGAVTQVEGKRGEQDPLAHFAMARYEKMQDSAAIYQDMRSAFHELKKQENPVRKKHHIERESVLVPSQVRFHRTLTAPEQFFHSPPKTAPATASSSGSPKSLVPELMEMLRDKPSS